jgi:tetratricopeptide (TPR) repeat protein
MSAGFGFRRLNGHGAGARDEMILKYFIPDFRRSEPQCAAEVIDGETRARLFLWAAVVLHVLGRVHDAVKFATAAQQLFEKFEDRVGFWFSTAHLSWFLAAEGNLDRAVELSESLVQVGDEELQDEPLWRLWKLIAKCLNACVVAYLGRFDRALELYQQAMNEKCDAVPHHFDLIFDILRFHYACLLLKRGYSKEAILEGRKLVEKCQGNPVLGFLGYQVLGRMELKKYSEKIVEGRRGKPGKPSLGKAIVYLDQGKDYLNLGPAFDQIIVNSLFMARFNRLNQDLEEADRYLKLAEDDVGPFELLKMDCLLERAWLCLAQGHIETAWEKWTTVGRRANSHGYHYIDDELKELEKQLRRRHRG